MILHGLGPSTGGHVSRVAPCEPCRMLPGSRAVPFRLVYNGEFASKLAWGQGMQQELGMSKGSQAA